MKRKILILMLLSVVIIFCFACGKNTFSSTDDGANTSTEEYTTTPLETTEAEIETISDTEKVINLIEDALSEGLTIERIDTINEIYDGLSNHEKQKLVKYDEYKKECIRFFTEYYTKKICEQIDTTKYIYEIDPYDDSISITMVEGTSLQIVEDDDYCLAQNPIIVITFNPENGKPYYPHLVWFWFYTSRNYFDTYVGDQTVTLLSSNSKRTNIALIYNDSDYGDTYSTHFYADFDTPEECEEILAVISDGTITARLNGTNNKNIQPTVTLGNDCIKNMMETIEVFKKVFDVTTK